MVSAHADYCDMVRSRIELLAGAPSPLSPDDRYWPAVCSEIEDLDSLSLGELNKLLLTAGFNRVAEGFFSWFTAHGTTFDERLTAWRVLAMRHFANFRYPFRKLTRLKKKRIERQFQPLDCSYLSRQGVLDGLHPIPAEDRPLLGVLSGPGVRLLRDTAEHGGSLTPAQEELVRRLDRAEIDGLHNTYEYCAMEHMDVYVSTSMRSPEDYSSLNRFLSELLVDDGDPDRLDTIAYFDPTLKWHEDRIVLGLVEALMLKRARCTLYLAQETDTFGKDSELASTLAQGKPVIAYIPTVSTEELVQTMDAELSAAAVETAGTEPSGGEPRYSRLTERIQRALPPNEDNPYYSGIKSERRYQAALRWFAKRLADLYDYRAGVLTGLHPLGIQVALDTGVPNGVLVTRSVEQCRAVLRDVLWDRMRFRIEARKRFDSDPASDLDSPREWDRLLREERTGSIFRVVVGNVLVSNSYWNSFGSERSAAAPLSEGGATVVAEEPPVP